MWVPVEVNRVATRFPGKLHVDRIVEVGKAGAELTTNAFSALRSRSPVPSAWWWLVHDVVRGEDLVTRE